MTDYNPDFTLGYGSEPMDADCRNCGKRLQWRKPISGPWWKWVHVGTVTIYCGGLDRAGFELAKQGAKAEPIHIEPHEEAGR